MTPVSHFDYILFHNYQNFVNSGPWKTRLNKIWGKKKLKKDFVRESYDKNKLDLCIAQLGTWPGFYLVNPNLTPFSN